MTASRLLTIEACCYCPHSGDTEVCYHPSHPQNKPLAEDRPPVGEQYGTFVSSAPPPPWCPLPSVEEVAAVKVCDLVLGNDFIAAADALQKSVMLSINSSDASAHLKKAMKNYNDVRVRIDEVSNLK